MRKFKSSRCLPKSPGPGGTHLAIVLSPSQRWLVHPPPLPGNRAGKQYRLIIAPHAHSPRGSWHRDNDKRFLVGEYLQHGVCQYTVSGPATFELQGFDQLTPGPVISARHPDMGEDRLRATVRAHLAIECRFIAQNTDLTRFMKYVKKACIAQNVAFFTTDKTMMWRQDTYS